MACSGVIARPSARDQTEALQAGGGARAPDHEQSEAGLLCCGRHLIWRRKRGRCTARLSTVHGDWMTVAGSGAMLRHPVPHRRT